MLDARYWMLDTGYTIPDAGYWLLDAGCWFLVAGFWPLGNRSQVLNAYVACQKLCSRFLIFFLAPAQPYVAGDQ
jgi:hypothetical protein